MTVEEIKKIKKVIKNIELSKLIIDKRNANVCNQEVLGKLKLNIKKTGQYPALIVRQDPGNQGQYILIDGHHRKIVLEELGYTQAFCEIWDVDQKDAALLLATLNRLRGEDDLRLRASLIEELQGYYNIDDLLKLIPDTKEEIDDLLNLMDMDLDIGNALNQIAKEEQELLDNMPETKVFHLNKEQADIVNQALAVDIFANQDPAIALTNLCQFVLEEQTK